MVQGRLRAFLALAAPRAGPRDRRAARARTRAAAGWSRGYSPSCCWFRGARPVCGQAGTGMLWGSGDPVLGGLIAIAAARAGRADNAAVDCVGLGVEGGNTPQSWHGSE